ncbi:MAG: CHASE3 domain-containing protein, partial [Pseudomonas sp.]
MRWSPISTIRLSAKIFTAFNATPQIPARTRLSTLAQAGMKNWSPPRFLTVAFVTVLLVFSLLAVMTWVNASKSTDASQWVEHTYQVRATLDRITSTLSEAEMAQRGYLLTGNPDHIRVRDDALSALGRAAETVDRLITDNAGQQIRLRQLQVLIAERAHLYHVNETLREREGLAAAPALVTGVSPLIGSMRTIITQMVDEENHLLGVRRQSEASRLHATRVSFIVLVAMLLAAVIMLFWRLRVDIRLRDRADATIRSNEALLKQILDVLPIAVSVADASGQLTLSNPAARTLSASITPVDTGRDHVKQGERSGNPHELAPHECALARAVLQGETFLNEEVEIKGSDQSRKFALLSAVPLRDDQQTIIGGVTVCQDVTALKQTEQLLRTAAHFDDSRSRALALFNASFDRQKIA